MSKVNIKDLRDKLIAKRALNEQNEQKAAQSIETVKKIFSGIDESKIELFANKGIDLRRVLSYDLERVYRDKEYHSKFREEFSKVLEEIEDLIMMESEGVV